MRFVIVPFLCSCLTAQIVVTGHASGTGDLSLTAMNSGSGNIQITGTSAGTISLTGASLSWVTNQPFYSPYSCYAQYGPTASYGASTSPTSGGIVGLTALTRGTTYHYRVNCTNGNVTVSSSDATFTTLAAIPNAPARTMIDDEFGVVLLSPPGGYATLGAGVYQDYPINAFGGMSASAVKANHTVFYAGGDSDQAHASYFPYNELAAYNMNEVKAGNVSLLVTATYNGSHYPLYSTISGNNCYNARQWMDISDPRYVRFFVNEDARKVLESEAFPTVTDTPYYRTQWMSSDEGAFQYQTSAIYPAGCSGNPVNAPTWDAPYPQNDAAMIQSIESFLYQMHQWAPDMHLAINEGSIVNMNLDNWFNLFGNFDGLDREGGFANGNSTSQQFEAGMQHQAMLISTGALLLERQITDQSSAQNENGIVRYLLIRGGNTFYSLANGPNQVDPATYQPIFDALGAPTANYLETTVGAHAYNAYYSRTYQGGLVYFNADTVSHTIALPAGTWYLNNSGSPVTTITLAGNTKADTTAGVYLTSQLGTFVSVPTYSPATIGKSITGPVSVTLSEATSGATIHYTTGGATPTCSSKSYTTALILTTSTTVNAIGCVSGAITSWPKTASYNIVSAQPTVSMVHATDSASSFFPGTYATLVLSNPSSAAVTANYSVTGTAGVAFSPAAGSLTIQPFETVKSAYIQASLKPGITSAQTVTVTITSAANATIGAQSSYVYTIFPYPFSPTTKWLKLAPVANAILSSSAPTAPYSPNSVATVIGTGDTGSTNYRTLLQYDLSSLPPNAVILSAQLKGFQTMVKDAAGSCSMKSSVYRMLTGWTQSGATWNNSGGNSANYAAAPTDTENACDPLIDFPTKSVDLFWNVTSDVQNIVSGTNANYGWVFMGPENQAAGEYWKWFSDKYVDGNQNPVSGIAVSLIVTYTLPQQ